MTGKTGKRENGSGRSKLKFCPPPKTDNTVQIEDQIELFIKKQVDVQL